MAATNNTWKNQVCETKTQIPPKKKNYNPTSTAPTSETNARYKIKAMQEDSSTVLSGSGYVFTVPKGGYWDFRELSTQGKGISPGYGY
jgi:hypothetical protein